MHQKVLEVRGCHAMVKIRCSGKNKKVKVHVAVWVKDGVQVAVWVKDGNGASGYNNKSTLGYGA